MNGMFRDWAYAARMLTKSPGLTVLTSLVFATGFGLAVYMFVLIRMLAYGELPFPNEDRIVTVDAVINGVEHESGRIPLHDYLHFAEHQDDFEVFFAGHDENVVLVEGNTARRAFGNVTGSDMFRLTATNPMFGRALVAADEKPGAPPVAVISHRLWQQFFGGDPQIVGRVVQMNDVPTTIVGVMPDGFSFPLISEVWLPLSTAGVAQPGAEPLVQIFGLLKPGHTREKADRRLNEEARLLEQQFPQTNQNHAIKVWPFTQIVMANSMGLITVMMGATGFILLLVCINVVNLLLARAGERQKELAVRAALGAPRARLIRQMMLEAITLALVGGVVGLFCAAWAMEWSREQIHGLGEGVPFWWNFSIDTDTVLFATVLVAGVGLLVGAIPAWRASSGDLTDYLRDGTRGALGRRVARFTRSLVGLEILLCAALLIVSGLLVRTMQISVNADYGARTENIMLGRLSLNKPEYRESGAASAAFAERVERELVAGLDPLSNKAIVATLLPGLSSPRTPAISEDMDAADRQFPKILVGSVTPGYFDALDVRILRGRGLLPSDDAASMPVAVVSESMAEQYWPGADAVGKRFKLDPQVADSPWVTVVGVSAQVLHGQPFEENRSKPVAYLPLAQKPERDLIVALRSPSTPSPDALTDAVARADAEVRVWRVEKLTDLISRNNNGMSFVSNLFLSFALLALLLAGSGIYAVTARSVQLRTQEIGVRRALGANERDVFVLLFKESGKQLAIGGGIGLLVGALLVKLLSTVLYNFTGEAPLMLAVVIVILGAIVGVATLVPALRAVRIPPNVALHHN